MWELKRAALMFVLVGAHKEDRIGSVQMIADQDAGTTVHGVMAGPLYPRCTRTTPKPPRRL
jgi:hypothetical protein